ncbi:MAG: DUF7553 family protein [Halobacteriota archaeon]|uniref:DUF7553 family protein n=1 Tax=Natronomonas sp. TaxID=2184060 RepID=UPI003975A941
MTREQLDQAAESLERAGEAARNDEARERLEKQAAAFETLATADRGPDHGKIARHEHILTEIAADEEAAAEHIEAALESIRAYRSTVEGV